MSTSANHGKVAFSGWPAPEAGSPTRHGQPRPGSGDDRAAGGPALSRRVFLVVAAVFGCVVAVIVAVVAMLSGTTQIWAMFLTVILETFFVTCWATWRGLRARPPARASPGTWRGPEHCRTAERSGGTTEPGWAGRRADSRWGAERRWRLLVAAMMAIATASGVIWLVGMASSGPSWPGPLPAGILFLVAPPFGIAALMWVPTDPAHPALTAPNAVLTVPARSPGAGGVDRVAQREETAGGRVGRRRGQADARARPHRWTVQLVLDALLVVGSIILITWAGLLASVVHSGQLVGKGAWLAAAQAGMLALEVVLVFLVGAFRRPRNTPAMLFLGVGLISVSISHALLNYSDLTDTGEPGTEAGLGFLVGPLLVALATAAPADLFRATRRRRRAAADRQPGPGGGLVPPTAALSERLALWAHVFLPYVPLGAAAAVVVVLLSAGDRLDGATVTLAAALVVIVLVRQLITVAQNTRLLASVEASQHELRYQARHDPLTGLANRAEFAELLAARVAARNRACSLADGRPRSAGRVGRPARTGPGRGERTAPARRPGAETRSTTARTPAGSCGQLAVLFCDLDDFKDVNDTLGHAVGDEVLRVAARRLRTSVRGQDVTARLGGDEFAILIDEQAPPVDGTAGMAEDAGPGATGGPDGATQPGQLAERAARLVTSAMSRPFQIGTQHYQVRASVGLAVEDGLRPVDPEELLRRADAAMYAAKRGGKGRLVIARSPVR